MEKYDSDRFEINNKNLFVFDETKENFFMQNNTINTQRNSIDTPMRRLNDYDFNILEDNAYKDVVSDSFKLEYKMLKIEKELNVLSIQIQTANDIQDYKTAEILSVRSVRLKEEYNKLLEEYNSQSLTSKVSDSITGIFKNSINGKPLEIDKQQNNNFLEKIKSKLPPKIVSFMKIKESLGKLENINKSVDELMGMSVPYGENSADKYEQLSKYIIKANSIHSEISKHIKK